MKNWSQIRIKLTAVLIVAIFHAYGLKRLRHFNAIDFSLVAGRLDELIKSGNSIFGPKHAQGEDCQNTFAKVAKRLLLRSI